MFGYLEKTLEDCRWCIGSRRSSKHLMVSMGKSVYLALPGVTSMAEGHCLIVPMNHYKAGITENIYFSPTENEKIQVYIGRRQSGKV